MDVPPSRYKVVEQGRRLVVIDTWNGDRPVARQAPRLEAGAPPRTPQEARAALRPSRQDRQAGGGSAGMDVPETIVSTWTWFDARGPRRIRLNANTQGVLLVAGIVAAVAVIVVILTWGWPVLAVLGFFLMQKKVREGLRSGVTAWLDGMPPG